MSIPNNPLDVGGTSTHRHILLAFEYAEDAVKLESFDPGKAIVGEPLKSDAFVGQTMVVVNETNDKRFSISEAMWDFNYAPTVGIITSTSVGRIVISDRRVAYSFLDFLRVNLLDTLGKGTSLSHVTFVLKTIFSVNSDVDGDEDHIYPRPFYFNIDSIETLPTKKSATPKNHILKAIGISNSLGLLPALSELNQFTITHKDGNIHNTLPSSGFQGSGGGIPTRSDDNTFNTSERKKRLDLSKPMVTLQDVFEGFEADLNQQRYAHKGQLQLWLREIRSGDTVDKILIAPEQKKGPDKSLPLTFKVDLDKEYRNYLVDNRNMPFEQPDVVQDKKGINVYSISAGSTICEAVTKIMYLSKAIGQDASVKYKTTFKTTITPIRTKTEYVINIKIRKYLIPNNPSDKKTNTGPGTGIYPLHFYINDGPERRHTDIVSMRSNIRYQSADVVLEQQKESPVGAGVVFADREQSTSERSPELGFYETLYSGVRSLTAPHVIDGLESAQQAGNIYTLLDADSYDQTTRCDLIIHGNPNLMSDMNRNPAEVVSDVDGEVNYYPKPETEPMYVKLTIFEAQINVEGIENDDVPNRFYFDEFYHMTRVVNVFGGGKGRSFYQYLSLQRTDDLI
jgi:hypothetical protein